MSERFSWRKIFRTRPFDGRKIEPNVGRNDTNASFTPNFGKSEISPSPSVHVWSGRREWVNWNRNIGVNRFDLEMLTVYYVTGTRFSLHRFSADGCYLLGLDGCLTLPLPLPVPFYIVCGYLLIRNFSHLTPTAAAAGACFALVCCSFSFLGFILSRFSALIRLSGSKLHRSTSKNIDIHTNTLTLTHTDTDTAYSLSWSDKAFNKQIANDFSLYFSPRFRFPVYYSLRLYVLCVHSLVLCVWFWWMEIKSHRAPEGPNQINATPARPKISASLSIVFISFIMQQFFFLNLWLISVDWQYIHLSYVCVTLYRI